MKNHVFLIGFSGSGKSTIGPKLARALNAQFVDTDVLIEKRCGKSIMRIFDEEGEGYFREQESLAIAEVLNGARRRLVVALGGGAFLRHRNRELVRRHGLVVYLSCSTSELYRRTRDMADRPLLSVTPSGRGKRRRMLLDKIGAMLRKRRTYYRQADVIISTTARTVADTVKTLQTKLQASDADR